MKNYKTATDWKFLGPAAGLVLVALVTPQVARAQGRGGPAGVDIKIRALNQSINDTPFCGVGPGMLGDKLAVDAFMDMNGVVTGIARFEDANGVVTMIQIDRQFGFGPGVLVQNSASQSTVAIWASDSLLPMSPALVNVEIPRNCINTRSTFTPGVDKVTMQMNFR